MSFGPVLVTGATGRQGRPLVIVVAELRHRLADPAYPNRRDVLRRDRRT